MGRHHFNFPPAPSLTAAKYMRSVYGPPYDSQSEPGQRYRCRRDMENSLDGYRSTVRGIREASDEIRHQRARSQSPLQQVPFRRSLRNSSVGFQTSYGIGSQWVHAYVPKWRTFSLTGYDFEHAGAMPRTYKFYGSINRMDEW